MAGGALTFVGLEQTLPGIADAPEASFGEQVGAWWTSSFLGNEPSVDFARNLGFEDDPYSIRESRLRERGVYDSFAAEAQKEAVAQRRLTGANARAVALSGELPIDSEVYSAALNRKIDDYIDSLRAQDINLAEGLKKSDEITAEMADRMQVANIEAEILNQNDPSWLTRNAAVFVGAGGATILTDPFNLATLPLGAASRAGMTVKEIIAAAATDGAINAGIEAFQADQRKEWLNKHGFEYGLGQAVGDIALAGGAGFLFSGLVRGVGRSIEGLRGAHDVMDAVSRDMTLPSEVRAAAQYEAAQAHIDGNMPVEKGLATEIEIQNHRRNLQEVIDALDNGREPNFIEVKDINRIAGDIDPKAFSRYYQAKNRYDLLIRSADEAYSEFISRITNDAAQKFDSKIADIESKIASANNRQAKVYEKRLAEIRSEKNAYIDAESQKALNETNELKLAAQSLDVEARAALEDVARARILAKESYKRSAREQIDQIDSSERILRETKIAKLQEAAKRNPQKAEIFRRQIDEIIAGSDRLVPDRKISKAEINKEAKQILDEIDIESRVQIIENDAPVRKMTPDELDSESADTLRIMDDSDPIFADFYRLVQSKPDGIAGVVVDADNKTVVTTFKQLSEQISDEEKIALAVKTCGA